MRLERETLKGRTMKILKKLLLHVGDSEITPQDENGMTTSPRRVLFQLPPELAPYLAQMGTVEIDAAEDRRLVDVLREEASQGMPEDFELLPETFRHVESGGAYLQSRPAGTSIRTNAGIFKMKGQASPRTKRRANAPRDGWTFLLGRREAGRAALFERSNTYNIAGEESVVQLRFHVVVEVL